VSRWGGFLDDIAGFDSEFFGISEREATAIDPQHRLLLETSWDAVGHAGLAPKSLADSRTGVFVGLAHDDYASVTGNAGALGDAYAFTGTPFSMASGRVYGIDVAILSIIQSPERFGAAGSLRDLPKGFAKPVIQSALTR
jgi:polyketide synthase 5